MFRSLAFIALVCAVLTTACTTWKQPKTPNFKNATQIEDMERLMWKAVQQGDWKSVQEHLGPSFVQLANGTRRDRAAALAAYKQLKFDDFSLGEVETQPDGEDIVITYTLSLRGGTSPSAAQHVMTVWQTVKGGWVEIAQSVQPAQ